MNFPRGLLLVLFSLAIVLVFLLVRPSREPGGREPTHVPVAEGSASTVQSPAPPVVALPEPVRPQRAPVPDTEAPVAPRSAALRVHVLLREDASPVVGAPVTCLLQPGRKPVEGVTDATGACQFDLAGFTGVALIRVNATPTTTAVDEWNPELGEWTETVERTVTVSRGSSLSGTVVDAEGAPVVGASVQGWCTANYPYELAPDRVVTTDAAGRFTLDHLGESFFVAASAREQCCRRGLRGRIVPGTSASGLEVVVAPCTTLRGHVVDDFGVALAGARVSFCNANSGSADDATAVSGVTRCYWGGGNLACDANGAFEFAGLPGPSYGGHAWCEHETCVGEHVAFDSSTDDNRLVLHRGADASGLVLRPDGTPAADAEVSLGHVGGQMREVRTGADGRFLAHGLPSQDRSILRVHHAGDAIHAGNVRVANGEPPIVVHLEPGRALAGTVLDESGLPVARARVHIEGHRMVDYVDTSFGEPTTWEFSHNIQNCVADAAGRFRIEDLYDDSFEITAKDPEQIVGARTVVARSGSEDLVLRFDASRTVTLTGRVVDELTGDAIRDFSILCMRPNKGDSGGWSGTSRPFATGDGRFRYGGVTPGKLELVVRSEGYAEGRIAPDEYAAGVHELEVRLAPVRTLELEVASADGRAVGNVQVSATDQDGKRLMLQSGLGSTSATIYAQASDVRLAGLPARRITVRVEHEERAFSFDFDLRTPLLGRQRVELKLEPEPSRIDVVVAFLDTRESSPESKIPSFAHEDVELDLEDAQGQHLSKLVVRPNGEKFAIIEAKKRSSSSYESEQAVAHVSLPTTLHHAKLHRAGRETVTLEVPAPGKDGRIFWVIDLAKL